MSDVEKACIGMLLRGDKNIIRGLAVGLKAEHFAEKVYADIFRAIDDVQRAGSAVDEHTVSSRLPEAAIEVVLAAADAPLTQNIEFYAKEIVAQSWVRHAKAMISDIAHRVLARRPHEPIADLEKDLFSAINELYSLRTSGGRRQWFRETADEALAEIQEAVDLRQGGKSLGISSGIKGLDYYIKGFQKELVYVLAARTSVGKTTMACNFAYAAATAGNNVGFYTVEMRSSALFKKTLSRRARVDHDKLVSGDLGPGDLEALETYAKDVYRLPIWSNHSFRRSIELLALEATIARRRGELDLLIIDYIQQLKLSTDREWTNRNAELTEVSAIIQALAKELGVPIIVLAQLNREATKSELPNIAQIRDCGSIEQDADVVMLLHRDDPPKLANSATTKIVTYNEDAERMPKHSLLIQKNRSGRCPGKVDLKADLPFNYFGDQDG